MPLHVVGHDGTDNSADAMALAVRLAGLRRAELLAVHVLAVPSLRRHLGGETIEHLDRGAGDALDRAREQLGDLPARPPRTMYADSAAAGLHEMCEAEGAELVTVGSTHRGAVGRVLAGTTAQRLLSGSRCPVALAPRGYADADVPFARVVAAYDGRRESDVAVDVAAHLAGLAGARLLVVTVVEGVGYEHAEEVARAGARRIPPELEVERVTLTGDAGAALAQAAGRAGDLLVMGSRGYGPMRAVLAGTVGQDVAREASSPLVYVPRGVEAESVLTDGAGTT